MKKRINRIIIPILVLVIPILFFVVPIFNGRTAYSILTYKDVYYESLSADRQAVYDKLIVKDVKITERKTGTPNFNTSTGQSVDDGSVVSNLEGVDVSEKDNYVRTFDTVTYTVEVNIDENPNANIPDGTILKGGVIKVKAIIPEKSEAVFYGIWDTEAWMKNVVENYVDTPDGINYAQSNIITAEYHIPTDVSLVGGTQELKFSLLIYGYTGELKELNALPRFEVWMEGNQPDNANSNAKKVTISDQEELYITGKDNFELNINEGPVNIAADVNNVTGQYINYELELQMKQYNTQNKNIIGVAFPKYNNIKGKIKLNYYYKLSSSSTWNLITNNTTGASGALNGAELVAINPDYHENENAKPFSTSNKESIHKYCYYLNDSSRNRLCPDVYGESTATLNDNILEFDIKDIHLESMYKDSDFVFRVDVSNYVKINNEFIELFIPLYDETKGYDYKVEVVIEEYSFYESIKETSVVNNSIPSVNKTISFKKNTGPKISAFFDIEEEIGNRINSSGVAYPNNESVDLYTDLNSTYAIYYGGVERYIFWDPHYFKYEKSTIVYSTDINAITLKYGVLKSNPKDGITGDSMINTANKDKFTWYNSKDEALKNGVICGLYIDDRAWQGFTLNSRLNIAFGAIANTENIGDVTFFRQHIYAYPDKNRTQVEEFFTNTNEDYYTPSKYENYKVITQESPEDAGESILIVADLLRSEISPSLKEDYFAKTKYDVSDGEIEFEIKTELYPKGGYINEEVLNDDIRVKVYIPEGLTFLENTTNITPKYINKIDDKTLYIDRQYKGGTVVEWEIKNVKIGDELDKIYFSVEIDPYIENNTNCKFYVFSSTNRHPDSYSGYTYQSNGTTHTLKYSHFSDQTISISNLSSASTRISLEQKYLEPNEKNQITTTTYNVSDLEFSNVKTIQRLPYNGDAYGSSFDGNYTLKVISLAENQKMYYTTNLFESLGITEDSSGNLSAKNINFATDSKWIEVKSGAIIPNGATAIATTTNTIASKTSKEHIIEFIPSSNSQGDKYVFRTFMTNDALENVISSNISEVIVSQRKASGTVFIDKNLNNIYDTGDSLYKGLTLQLLDENNNIVQTTTTDNNGYYEFSNVLKGNYRIRANVTNGYGIVSKNVGLNYESSVFNSNGETDLLTGLNGEIRSEVYNEDNINLGLTQKEVTITVYHYIDGTTTRISNPVTITKKSAEEYTTNPATNIDSNYELSSIPNNASGIVNDNITVIYYYKLKTATLTVHHYIEGTTTSLIADEISTVTYTHTYQTSQLKENNILKNYELASTQGTLQGTVSGNIEVTYYYKLKSSTLVVKHLEYGTNKELVPHESKTLKYTDEYETSVSTSVPGNYEYYSKTDNYKGIVATDNIEVIYYYQEKDSQLSSSIRLTSPEEITTKTQKVNYKLEYTSTINDYRGSGTTTIIVQLPYHIDENKSNLNGGTYNSDLKTITWITTEEDINATSEQKVISGNKDFSVTFSDLVSTDRTMNTSVTSHIKLENNETNAEDNQTTYIKIQGKIIVHHYVEGTTTKVVDDIETTNLVGETYVSESVEKKGYLLKKEPENKNHIYQDETQEIIYEYERIKFNIITKVDGGEGTIGGDETVFYGDNSTEGNIVIKPNKGYQVSHIIVNGEEKSIEECKNGCILNNFIEVYEDKEIIVVFEALPNNPETSSIITITSVIGLTVLSTGAYILIKKYKPSIKKI